MRKLSEISGADGIAAIGGMLPRIEKMIRNTKKGDNMSPLEYLGAMLKNSPKDAVALMAALDGVPVEDYEKKSFLELIKDMNDMIADEELQQLFGLQK